MNFGKYTGVHFVNSEVEQFSNGDIDDIEKAIKKKKLNIEEIRRKLICGIYNGGTVFRAEQGSAKCIFSAAETTNVSFKDYGNNKDNFLKWIYKGCIQDNETLRTVSSKELMYYQLLTIGRSINPLHRR